MAGSRIWWLGLALAAAPLAVHAEAEAPKPSDPGKPAAPPASAPAKAPAKAAPKTVEAITVTGSAPDSTSTLDAKSYTLGKDLAATNGSIADALRNLPSVEVDLQGGLSLRGDTNVTILVDGKPSPMFDGKDRADALQQLPADQYERVEVITNPSAALNPEGTAGVINLITRKSRGAGVTGSAYVTASTAALKRMGASFGYNTKTLAITGSLAGNYQRNKNHIHDVKVGPEPTTGQILTSRDDSIGRNISRGPSGRINITWTPDPKDQFTAAGSYNSFLVHGHPFDAFETDTAAGTPVSLLSTLGHRRFLETDNSISAGWRHTFGEGHELSADALYNDSLGRDHTLFDETQVLPTPNLLREKIRDDSSEHHSEFRLAYSQRVAGGALKVGYELKHDDNDANYKDAKGPTEAGLVDVPALANHYLFTQDINAAYATYQRAFGDLDVQGGLRIEEVRFTLAQLTAGLRPGQDYSKAYPSLHLAYKLDDERKVTASFSERVQRPPVVFLNPLIYIEGPRQTQQGNPNLKPQDTQSFELGYEKRDGQSNYQATLYYRRYVNQFSNFQVDQGGGVFLETFGNLGSARNVGLELTAGGKVSSKISYTASTNLYWSEVDGGNLGIGASAQSGFGAAGRANLNWQVRPDDMVQLNAIVNGRRLIAQGVLEPVFTLNLGWRHKLNDRITATLTAQDVAGTNRFHRRLDTPALVDRFDFEPVARSITLRLDYRFGGGAAKAAKDPGFEYENAGGPG